MLTFRINSGEVASTKRKLFRSYSILRVAEKPFFIIESLRLSLRLLGVNTSLDTGRENLILLLDIIFSFGL